jgi:mannose-6-phosphate isomerase-like protein (cupin superfamily)
VTGVQTCALPICKIDLVIIEAQVGDYLGEDDIVRIEDDFKRA